MPALAALPLLLAPLPTAGAASAACTAALRAACPSPHSMATQAAGAALPSSPASGAAQQAQCFEPGGYYTEAMCCAPPAGDPSCWDGKEFTYAKCCPRSPACAVCAGEQQRSLKVVCIPIPLSPVPTPRNGSVTAP